MDITCPRCGGKKVESEVAIGLSNETGNIGPKFNKGIFVGEVQMYCDLCTDCGEIIRFYIKDLTERKWNKKPGSFGSK